MIAALKQLTLFMLAGQMILHLLPDGGFDKYVRMLFRMMILSRFVLLILSFERDNVEEIFEKSISEYMEQSEQIQREAENFQIIQFQMIEEVIRSDGRFPETEKMDDEGEYGGDDSGRSSAAGDIGSDRTQKEYSDGSG